MNLVVRRDPLLASVAVCCVSDVGAIPAAGCRSGAIFVVGSGGELPPQVGNQHLFAWIKGPYNMHAAALVP
ncbi:hypothetical protein [Pseudomonas guariconensis]|uniref:hypothetical protein n=1 Tax=Pseudomonas guariconensis TaxID=1288410 RepID=UPI0018D8D461|nr:hypothetical protein [Pseudomonas guariconensis]MBH3361376.1 hypothetical protein [Pseudomonas guariconensis]